MAKTVKKAAAAAKPAEAVKTPAAEPVKAPVAPKATKTTAKPKTAKAPAKTKAAPKKASAKAPAKASGVKVFLEYQGYQVDMDAILEAVKTTAGVKTVKSMEVYVKPEDGAAYYVINGKETGKATL